MLTDSVTTMAIALTVRLPAHTIRYIEGGEFTYNGELYSSLDSLYGSVQQVDDFTSGIGDEAPGFEIMWNPASVAAATDLSGIDKQGAEVEIDVLEINRATGAITADVRMFTGVIDYTIIEGAKNQRVLRMGLTTDIDRVFNTDKGNTLNTAFHKKVNPGELGLDYTTSTTIPQPWGDKGPKYRPNTGGGGGGAPAVPLIRPF